MRVKDRDVQPVRNSSNGDMQPIFSPDGKWVVCETTSLEGGLLHRMRIDGSERQVLTEVGFWNAVFTPGGDEIIGQAEGFDGLVVLSLDDLSLRPLTWLPEGAFRPSFSSDGKRMLYELHAENDDYRLGQVFIADADGSNPRQLTYRKLGAVDAKFLKGDDQIVFVGDHVSQIYRMDLKTRQVKRLTKESHGGWLLAIDPRSGRIAYFSTEHYAVWTMEPDGSDKRPLVLPK